MQMWLSYDWPFCDWFEGGLFIFPNLSGWFDFALFTTGWKPFWSFCVSLDGRGPGVHGTIGSVGLGGGPRWSLT